MSEAFYFAMHFVFVGGPGGSGRSGAARVLLSLLQSFMLQQALWRLPCRAPHLWHAVQAGGEVSKKAHAMPPLFSLPLLSHPAGSVAAPFREVQFSHELFDNRSPDDTWTFFPPRRRHRPSSLRAPSDRPWVASPTQHHTDDKRPPDSRPRSPPPPLPPHRPSGSVDCAGELSVASTAHPSSSPRLAYRLPPPPPLAASPLSSTPPPPLQHFLSDPFP